MNTKLYATKEGGSEGERESHADRCNLSPPKRVRQVDHKSDFNLSNLVKFCIKTEKGWSIALSVVCA